MPELCSINISPLRGVTRSLPLPVLTALQNNHAGDRINRLRRQLHGDTSIVRRELKILPGTGQQIRSLHIRPPRRDAKVSVLRPVEYVQIDTARLARSATESQLRGKRTRGRSIDGFAVLFHPAPYPAQALDTRLRNQTFGGRSHVEQIIPALRSDVDQIAHDSLGGLPLVVVELVAPGGVHRHATLPI